MIVVVVLVFVAVLALLAGAHWYVWRRLVRDTTQARGVARGVGTVALWVLPLLSFGALVAGRAGAPFWLERVVAWPGYLWLAVLLYLVLALLVGEVVRAVWLRRSRGSQQPQQLRGAGASAAPSPIDAPPSNQEPAVVTVPPSEPATNTSTESGTTALPSSGRTHTENAPAAASAATDTPSSVRGTGAGDTDTSADRAPTHEVKPATTPDDPRTVSRRLFVSRVVGGGAAVAALGTVGHGAYGVLRGPKIKRVTVPLAKLPRSAHGFRIAVVSDIHLGPILGRAHTQRIVDTINAASPDLVAVVGDMVDGSVADLGSAAEPLNQLRARHGSFFVTGNHEYFSGAEEWVDHVRELGLRPLENERVEIAGFDLAGVDDIEGEKFGRGPDFRKALGDRDSARAAVLLAHQPVVIHDAVEHGVDLQLSGHTHGGQLWPGNHLAALANPTVAGLERYGDTQLYVTRGAGAWGPPVRVGASSDITVVQLASRQA
ncbi:metallophosphoesterase [Streptomyces sp. NBC_00690]|uniref:metallophosphoesterase n=1 Tax=Streptomyces sp. NBC_00690 TaxID=2975808 RepID=UPI002E27D79A|nr:metallophosphoesterase [Streptomyces sp. NBC_00690]